MKIYGFNNELNKKKLAFNFCEHVVLNNNFNLIFLCVGNSNVVADLFGPMCGSLLKQKNKNLNVFGTLENNVTSKNLEKIFNKIKQEYVNPLIIVIDSALGQVEEVGQLKFFEHGCLPAHKTNNIVMGNLSFLGVVNTIGISDFLILKSVKFNNVCLLSEFCVNSILEGLKLIEIYKNSSNKISV